MSDEIQEPESQKEEQESESVDTKIADAIAEAKAEMEKTFKSEIAGLNRRNDELSKELETERTAHMSDKERLEHEKELREKELAEREARIEKAERDSLITQGLAEAKLSPSIKNLMYMPKDEQGVASWITAFDAAVKAEADARVNQVLASGGAAKGGKSTNGKPRAETFEDGKNMTETEFSTWLKEVIET